ncbi:MAG: pro-sigmaK processing inhibitor BofA family protein, partial [Oscillospiraceae bacterium]|nr:pro-sigmaK processing inhibitor BofA family protein [Oscillospiraceae bacterium]
ETLSILVAVLAIFLVIKVISAPIRWMWKLVINTLAGAFFLFLINALQPLTGLYLEITTVRACLVGFLGLPGLVVVLVLYYFF